MDLRGLHTALSAFWRHGSALHHDRKLLRQFAVIVRQLLRRASDAGSLIIINRRCAAKHCSYIISDYGGEWTRNIQWAVFQAGDILKTGQVKELLERCKVHTLNYCYEYTNRFGGTWRSDTVVYQRCTKKFVIILSCFRGCAWLIDGFWIGWLDLLTYSALGTTGNFSAIANLRTFQFTAANTLGFSVFPQP
jgi:hypothetical protein